MKNKLRYLTEVSLKRKIKTKWFLVANALLALAVICVLNIDSIITFFGGDFNEKTKIYIIDNTDYDFKDVFSNQLTVLDQSVNGEESESYEFILTDKSEAEITKTIEDDENNALLMVINENQETVIGIKVVSESFIDTIQYQLMSTAINNSKTSIALATTNVSEEELNRLYSTVTIDRVVLDEDKNSEDENMEMIMTTVFPMVILPFFMLTIFLVQMIGAEINDEKTTRGMEIIISNVSPKTHLLSKILSGNVFVLLQGGLLILYFGLGLGIRFLMSSGDIASGLGSSVMDIVNQVLATGLSDKLIYVIPLTLILMIITFVAYSLLAGILASMTTNAEDFGQLQTPIMLISLAGYYLSMMAGLFKGALFIRILSYVPLISAILSPSLLVLGQIGIIDVIISIIIVIGFNYLLIKYGLKIYKIGILNYSSKDLWKKMFKAIKEK
ncbi:MAG: hypothetical protein PHN42_00525 [Bacilli bacterium]|nr:hypothetical protein [Bacilli bacterium]